MSTVVGMAWWLILVVAAVIGVIVIGIAIASVRGKLPGLRAGLIVLDERRSAAMRLQNRLEGLKTEAEELQAKIPQRG